MPELRRLPILHVALCSAVLASVPAVSPAQSLASALRARSSLEQALPAESVWLQQWWQPDTGTWSALGLLAFRREGDRVVGEPLAATYTTRNVRLPDGPLTGEASGRGVRLVGTFGKRVDDEGRQTGQDLVLEFCLELADGRTLAGATFERGAQQGRTRFVRLSDAEFLHRLELAQREWSIERQVVEAGFGPLQDAIAFLQKQPEDDRALGRQGLQSQSTMVLDDLRNRLAVEELRHRATSSGESAVREMITRLRAQWGTLASSPVVVDEPRDEESFWRQEWQAPDRGDWILLGVVAMHVANGTAVAVPMSPTYTHRGTQLPHGPLRGTRTPRELTLRGTFDGERDPDGDEAPPTRELEFRLRAADSDRVLEGSILAGGRELGRTRFTRLDGREALLAELQAADDRWALEAAVVKGTIPPLRNEVSSLERRDQWERQGGAGGLGDFARIQLDHARRSILVEELRLATCVSGAMTLRDLRIRLEANVASGR
ncbi:MAG: hypothetical protein IPM29_07160 [Planctomycetes bacterium]|nr:hypothetical protein [Planctomycetota bacterium]